MAQTGRTFPSVQPVGPRYKGIAAPFTRRPGGPFNAVGTRDVLWSSITNILMTPRGMRVMLPEFGSMLPYLVNEPNDELLDAQLRQETVDALERWEPRIRLRDVQILHDAFNDQRIQISLVYAIVGEDVVEKRTLLLNLSSTLTVESIQ